MLFSSALQVRQDSDFLSMRSLARTPRLWLYCNSTVLHSQRVTNEDPPRRLPSLSVRLSVISQTMPSCMLRQDVIRAFSRPRVDYGEHSGYILLGPCTKSLMAVRACYIAVPLYVCGFLVLGRAFQQHDSVGALVIGWGSAEVVIMVNTVAVCASFYDARTTREYSRSFTLDAYTNDFFQIHHGEISALLNLARTLGGFVNAYFYLPWSS